MTILNRDQILMASDIQTEEVPTPEWDSVLKTPDADDHAAVLVRGMTGAELDAYQAATIEMRGAARVYRLENLRARLLSFCIVDETGKRLFTANDIKALGDKSAVPIERLSNVARRLSGLNQEDDEAKN